MPAATLNPARITRALVVSAMTVTLAALGHLIGGGHLPHPAALVILTTLITPITWCVTSAQLNRYATTSYVAGSQLLLHSCLAWLTPAARQTTSTHHGQAHHSPGHHSHGHGQHQFPELNHHAGTFLDHLTHGGPLMLTSHLVAGILVGAALVYGDALLASIRRVLLPILGWTTPTPPTRPTAPKPIWQLPTWYDCHCVTTAPSRGPPSLA